MDIASEDRVRASSLPSAALNVASAEMTIISLIRSMLRRRTDEQIDVTLESNLYEDLMFDSLEIAELSTALEDNLRTDPYSVGIVPLTVGELVEFYESSLT